MYLVIIDGGADWVATTEMVQQQFPWIEFMHCVAHEGSLIIKDICKIAEISELLSWLTDAQKWFSTGKTSPLLKAICVRRYKSTRAFIYPADTRFAGKLLQIKRFLSMKDALRELVRSAEYRGFEFVDDIHTPRVEGDEDWDLMERVVQATGPVLLLLRLADTNKATLSKLKGTVDYISNLMVDSGNYTLEDQIATAFHNRVHELECDIANAAYVLDPQFVSKSRNSGPTVNRSFWKIARNIFKPEDEGDWRRLRAILVSELAKFRMKTGGFAFEDYSLPDTCAFWVAAGCYAPKLKKLALCLTPLPCSSGEAERNWMEVKQNMVKNRNRLDRAKVEKMVFVRRFIRMKRTLAFSPDNTVFDGWVGEMLKKAATVEVVEEAEMLLGGDQSNSDVFQDEIEPGEQGKINGKEPGEPTIPLTTLKKDNAAKSWLYEKYCKMCFLDKNPEGEDPLSDEDEWEHRVIKNVVWSRHTGYVVESEIYGNPTEQSIETYKINDILIQMIRDSPHNTRRIASVIEQERRDRPDDTVDETTPTPDVDPRGQVEHV